MAIVAAGVGVVATQQLASLEARATTLSSGDRRVGDRRGAGSRGRASSESASNVTGVAYAARTTTVGVGQAQQASAELARISGDLRQLVGQFRY